MADDITDLISRIRLLSREEAMEAGLALGEDLIESADQSAPLTAASASFVASVEASPLEHIEDVEELARVMLVAAAADPEFGPVVGEILDAVGRKAFLLGGSEIVALAAVAVSALHVVISKGRRAVSKTTTLRFGPDGGVTEFVIEDKVEFGISSSGVADIVESAADST
jgi:hypothetical protein